MPNVRILIFSTVVALALSAVAVFSAVSLATTGPGSRVEVYVDILNKSVWVEMETQSDFKGGLEMYMTDPSEVMRGEVAKFEVWNETKSPRTFTIFHKKVSNVKPGHRASILVPLDKRGSFPYVITGAKGTKTYKGVFLVN